MSRRLKVERSSANVFRDLLQGVLLYDGDETLSFGEHLTAAPFPTLWA